MLASFLLPLIAAMAMLTSSVYSRPRFTSSFDDESWSPEHGGLDTLLQAVAYNYKATTTTDDRLSPVKMSSLGVYDTRREMKRVNPITDDQLSPVKRSSLYDVRRNRNAFPGPLEVRWWWEKVATTPTPKVPRWPILLVPRFG